jgi:hypothetical protein
MKWNSNDKSCKLCRRSGLELQDSHFLSKGIYKCLRDEGLGNPNPVLVTGTGAVQTSFQQSAHLLCGDCEQRLSKNGEQWLLGHCLRSDGSFRLRDTLFSRLPNISSPTSSTRVYWGAGIPEINVSAIMYFAASIFWRGSIYPWTEDWEIPVRLGPIQEQFRLYLMEEQAFPSRAALSVTVRTESGIDRVTYGPAGRRRGDQRHFRFTMPGFVFLLTTGAELPQVLLNCSIAHNADRPLIVAPMVDDLILREIGPLVRRSTGAQLGIA